MKLIGGILLLGTQTTATLHPEALDYVLRAINYLTSVQGGAFSCVFYDVSPRNPYDNILNSLLKSPQLHNVAKYVLNRIFHADLEKLPWHPSLLLIHPGNDADIPELGNMPYLLQLFDPTTKVLVFVDTSNKPLAGSIKYQLDRVGFSYSVYFDAATMRDFQCNGGWWFWSFPKAPHPMYLFTYGARALHGRNVTYISNERSVAFAWNHNWINETARYLGTVAVELQHACNESDPTFDRCVQLHRIEQDRADILFVYMVMIGNMKRDFRRVFTTTPLRAKIAVPRDRPLNTIELMLMPFSWPVWTVLLTILILSELAKHTFPRLFKNDPFLLVVCGFGRRNLHLTDRWEKLILHSLIMLMFFMSNAFETKIISLMVRKPSVQRIRTLEDFAKSGLKILADVDNNPHYLDNAVIGNMLVQGQDPDLWETAPYARVWYSEWIDLFEELTFDYDRMQPYYVVLEGEYSAGPEFYATRWRSLLVEFFEFMHLALEEAGLMDLWKRQWKDRMRYEYVGRRVRKDIRDKVDLDFDDMEPAWLVLGVGLSVSMIGFVGEHIRKSVEAWLVMQSLRVTLAKKVINI